MFYPLIKTAYHKTHDLLFDSISWNFPFFTKQNFAEKTLEDYVSTHFMELDEENQFVDIVACNSICKPSMSDSSPLVQT